MTETLKRIVESGLSPNQYFLLYALYEGLDHSGLNIDLEQEVESLKTLGLYDGTTVKTSLFGEVSEQGFLMKAIEYIRIFPPIVLPTGVHARGKRSHVMSKLRTFIKLYPYDWDLIYAATEKYVNRYARERYAYMKNAASFIFDKDGDSTLALECDTVEYIDKTERSL